MDAGATGPAADLYLHSAERCGNCHATMAEQWQDSAHARSALSPLFLAMQAADPDPNSCDRCHRPLAGTGAPDSLVAEGVTCDVCHTVRAVELGPHGADLIATIGQPIRYGPYCQLDEHYFHRMGCSPLHESSQLCAGCHLFDRSVAGGAQIPVYTSYREWSNSDYARRRDTVHCQSCHMPGRPGSLAEGGPERERIGHHGMMGEGGALRGSAVAAVMTGKPLGDDRIEVDVRLTNRAAGHALPTGSPDRRLVVSVAVRDQGGATSSEQSIALGRMLIDATGAPAAHGRAREVAADSRIQPGQTWRHRFVVEAKGAGTVRLVVTARPLAHDIAAAMSLEPPPDQLLGSVELPFAAKPAARRRDLARRVRIAP